MKALVVMSIVLGLVMIMAPLDEAHAQTAPTAPTATAAGSGNSDVSPAAAELLSLTGTAAAYGTIAIGFQHKSLGLLIGGATGALILPSAGRWYAHSAGLGSFMLRAIGFAVAAGGVATALAPNPAGVITAGLFLSAGAAAILTSTVYDLYRAPLDALAHNTPLQNIQIVPSVQPEHHHNGFGFSLSATF